MANFNIDYLVVAGGGGGGGSAWTTGGASGGGGGGGEYLYQTSQSLLTSTSYSITVGGGGAASGYGTAAGQGSDSEFNSTTVNGGGRGASGNGIPYATETPGGSGGSGGGGAAGPAPNTPAAGGASVIEGGGLGFAGGSFTSRSTRWGSGGGGGAGSVGANGNSSYGGNGGNGASNSITGTNTTYAGGGGGGTFNGGATYAGSGGTGGGGGATATTGSNGANNKGAGGGGGSYDSAHYGGGTGGSGVVILRYATADVADYSAIGIIPAKDTTTVPGQTILSFTTVGTGTITFTPLPPPITPFDGTKATTPVTGFNKTGTSEGLKLPSGTNANQPIGAFAEQGMIRNDTEETVDSSASAMTHYNGTNWQYFAATESPDNPLPAGAQIVYSANDTASYPGTGTTWFDISGNSNDATLTNTTYSNGYLSFNGSSSKVTTSYSTNTSNASFAAWVNCNNVSTYNNFVSKGYYSSGSNTNYLHLVNYANASPVFTIRLNGSSVSAQSSVAMTNNTWHHVVGTVSSTGDMKIYLDGTQTGSQTGAPARNMTQSVLSGVYLDGNQQFFSGEISKIQVYDTVLTATDVTDLYNAGSGTT
jgi:hypothetical protein